MGAVAAAAAGPVFTPGYDPDDDLSAAGAANTMIPDHEKASADQDGSSGHRRSLRVVIGSDSRTKVIIVGWFHCSLPASNSAAQPYM
jgi:hypothetical protein